MVGEIQLLQFFICRNFKETGRDGYSAEHIHSNLYVSHFPHHFSETYVVTCWRKDPRFHKEVLEYVPENGPALRTPPMDIEPVTNSVLFRWHKHLFPQDLVIHKPSLLSIRVILDWKTQFESYLMIEKSA
ncbi:MAG: hypothetical protein HYZ85_03410 [Candidatus Omnitrophica bacterium]|nr:hypothetical protein [Candidatus Omnitrophota bacterium]